MPNAIRRNSAEVAKEHRIKHVAPAPAQIMQTFRNPNSVVRGPVNGPTKFHSKRWELKIQAVVVEDTPRSSKKVEKRMEKLRDMPGSVTWKK